MPLSFVAGLLFPAFFANLGTDRSTDLLIGFVVLPFAMLLDAFVISYFGTTPGKAIAGLYVTDLNHEKLSFETSLKRNALVYAKGLVLGLPVLCLFGYISGYNAVRDDGATSWDEDTGSRVFSSGGNEARTVLIAVLAIGANAAAQLLGQVS